MKHIISRISAIIVCATLLTLSAGAQSLKGSYFLDGSIQRTALNPAFMPRTSYITIPALGALQADLQSNLGLETFLYPKSGHLYSFLNQNVSAGEFTDKLTDDLNFGLSLNIPVLNFGFFVGKHGFLSFDIGSDIYADGIVSQDLFKFLKVGMDGSSTSYNMAGTDLTQSFVVHGGIGYTMDLSEKVPGLSLGAKVKILALGDYASVDMAKANVNLSEDQWVMDSKIEATVAMDGLEKDPSKADSIFPYKTGG